MEFEFAGCSKSNSWNERWRPLFQRSQCIIDFRCIDCEFSDARRRCGHYSSDCGWNHVGWYFHFDAWRSRNFGRICGIEKRDIRNGHARPDNGSARYGDCNISGRIHHAEWCGIYVMWHFCNMFTDNAEFNRENCVWQHSAFKRFSIDGFRYDFACLHIVCNLLVHGES